MSTMIERGAIGARAMGEAATGALLGRLGRLVKGHVDAVVMARRRRATIAALQALDDRTLRDIGIDRSEITSLVVDGSDHRQRTL